MTDPLDPGSKPEGGNSFDRLPLRQRLINGAIRLGDSWRAGHRCRGGWSDACMDEEAKRTEFCGVKMFWVRLAVEAGRKVPPGPYSVLEHMTATELAASGLTVVLAVPSCGEVRIGRAGGLSVEQAVELAERGDGFKTVAQVLKAFPGSRMVGAVDRHDRGA